MKQTTNHKLISNLVKCLLLFVLSFSLSNCQVEEIDNTINSTIQTVKPNEAILFLQNNKVLNSNKKGKTITFSPDLNNITLEKLTNSDQLLTVIPLDQNLKDTPSRILLLKINNEIKKTIESLLDQKEEELQSKQEDTTENNQLD